MSPSSIRQRPAAAPTSAPATVSAVRTLDLTKTYGSGSTLVRALRAVTLDIPSGQFTAIMGASGSGKSTLLHCITGLDTPTSGHVWIGGTEITGLDDDSLTKLRRDHIGFVFQSFNLMPTLTAADNITMPLRLSGRKVDRDWFDHVTGLLGLTDRLDHKPSELSGGQQQRVAVARALVTRPRVIVADEPTGALDSEASEDLLSFLRHCVDDLGQTVVMVTHDPSAAAVADRTVRVSDGQVTENLPRGVRA